MKAVLKPQRVQHGNTNQEAGCRAAGQGCTLYRGEEEEGLLSEEKIVQYPKSPTSVALVLGSLPSRSAGTRSPASSLH